MAFKSKVAVALIAAASAVVVAWINNGGTSTVWRDWVSGAPSAEDMFPGHGKQWGGWIHSLYDVPVVAGDARTHVARQQNDTLEYIVPRFNRPERFDVQVTVSWNAGSRVGGCGLVLVVGRQAQYAFTVTADGRVAVSLIKGTGMDDTEYQTLTGPSLVPAAMRTGEEKLIVKVRGQMLSFFVGSQNVASIVDTVMLDDWVLGVFAQGHREVKLDQLIILAGEE